ncbi:MAG TPA: GTP 3',8-cyclase MoaA [Candidatus Tripitaka californicus]|uniref:GTP 3',8-cyclase MoaA n=2 Tax=Candidatus Tripitaka californicus TaxID=3367616 RepID=UPI004029F175|nr:GTP 3',8-cyclase MoaA [Planctomycetota bacterium]
MQDRFQRNVTRLRVSVTDLCNLSCVYCRPSQGVPHLERKDILSFEEIATVVKYGAELGIRSIRLTGGEPLTRRNVERLVASLSKIPGIEDLAMTTNGVLLRQYAAVLKEAGLMRLNVSLDSLRADRFRQITGGGSISDVLQGIEEALHVGFQETKVNMVVMRGTNEDEVEEFARMSLEKPLEVRFIEYMAFGCRMIEERKFVPSKEVMERISRLGELIPVGRNRPLGPSNRDRSKVENPPSFGRDLSLLPLRGPARLYRLKGAVGTLGFISPVSQPFCGDCNRLRLTSDGKLRACLLAGGEVDIRAILRGNPTPEAIKRAFLEAAVLKPAEHPGTGEAVMCRIGG